MTRTRSQQVNDIFSRFTEVFEILTPFFEGKKVDGIDFDKEHAEFKSLLKQINENYDSFNAGQKQFIENAITKSSLLQFKYSAHARRQRSLSRSRTEDSSVSNASLISFSPSESSLGAMTEPDGAKSSGGSDADTKPYAESEKVKFELERDELMLEHEKKKLEFRFKVEDEEDALLEEERQLALKRKTKRRALELEKFTLKESLLKVKCFDAVGADAFQEPRKVTDDDIFIDLEFLKGKTTASSLDDKGATDMKKITPSFPDVKGASINPTLSPPVPSLSSSTFASSILPTSTVLSASLFSFSLGSSDSAESSGGDFPFSLGSSDSAESSGGDSPFKYG